MACIFLHLSEYNMHIVFPQKRKRALNRVHISLVKGNAVSTIRTCKNGVHVAIYVNMMFLTTQQEFVGMSVPTGRFSSI